MLETLERREVITTDPTEADKCCGMARDDDGFCVHRPYHPVYVDVTAAGHNHVTRDIKPQGECPACDKYHQKHRKPMGAWE